VPSSFSLSGNKGAYYSDHAEELDADIERRLKSAEAAKYSSETSRYGGFSR
jgi:hypothetical protein